MVLEQRAQTIEPAVLSETTAGPADPSRRRGFGGSRESKGHRVASEKQRQKSWSPENHGLASDQHDWP
jgi:hypothetical protein